MLVRRDADDIREIRPRAALGALVVVCAMLVLVVRLYQLQILRGEDYVIQSIANFRKSLFVPADRGLIKDRNGRTLVDNRPSFDVFMTPAFCKGKERDEVIARLKTYLLLTDEDVTRIRSDYQKSWLNKDKLERFKPFLVELDIPRDQVDVLEAHKTEMTCVNLIPTPHRSYHAPVSLGHVLGYMSEVTPDEMDDHPEYRRGQTIGRRGLERRWERELRGADGKQNIAVDAKGRELDKDTQEALIPESERLVPATPGNNLVLSIDARLQAAADAAFPGRAGAVVVMEAKTGFVLAMVSRPSFDPNKMSGRISRAELAAINADPLKPMLFRVMNENYHPGSTFKPVTSLAALESNVIGPNSTVSCNGGYTMGNHRWRCDKPSGHGSLDVKHALQVSCDVFYYSVGDRAGLDAISSMAHSLGYGQPTGFDLGREIPGIIPDTRSIQPDQRQRPLAGHQRRHRPGRDQRDSAAAGGGLRGHRQRRRGAAAADRPPRGDPRRQAGARVQAGGAAQGIAEGLLARGGARRAGRGGQRAWRDRLPVAPRRRAVRRQDRDGAGDEAGPEAEAGSQRAGVLLPRPCLVRLLRARAGSRDRRGGAERARGMGSGGGRPGGGEGDRGLFPDEPRRERARPRPGSGTGALHRDLLGGAMTLRTAKWL